MIARQMGVNRFVSCQDEYSLVVRDIEKDLLPAAKEYKLGLLPFFPLASGLADRQVPARRAPHPPTPASARLPALRDRYVTPRNEGIVEKLKAFAAKRGHNHAGARILLAGVARAGVERDRRRHRPNRSSRT